MKKFIEDTNVGLELRDGVMLSDEGPLVNEKDGPILWLYALIGNADILLSRSAYEITIEARFVHRVGDYLFIGDTSGVGYEDYMSRFAFACDYFSLAGCLEEDALVRQAS